MNTTSSLLIDNAWTWTWGRNDQVKESDPLAFGSIWRTWRGRRMRIGSFICHVVNWNFSHGRPIAVIVTIFIFNIASNRCNGSAWSSYLETCQLHPSKLVSVGQPHHWPQISIFFVYVHLSLLCLCSSFFAVPWNSSTRTHLNSKILSMWQRCLIDGLIWGWDGKASM